MHSTATAVWWKPLRIETPEISFENILKFNSLDFLEEQSDLGHNTFVSPISPITQISSADNILNIMQNIPREKYFDIVSKGFWVFVVIGSD